MSVQVSYKKQIGLGFLLLLSLLIILEFGARAYDFFNPYCSLKSDTQVYFEMSYWEKAKICDGWLSLVWHWDDETNVYTLEPNQHKETVNINNHGFRGPDISENKSEDTFRIFVIGGSTTISLRAPSDDQTHPGFLQKYFDNSDLEKKVEVINAGTPSFTSSQELSVVKNKLVNFEPDLIVVYDGTNDLNLPYGYTPEKTSFRSSIADGFNRYLPFWETVPIVYHIINNLGHEETSYEFDSSTIDQKVHAWKTNIEEICDIGKTNDFDIVVVLQPILGSGNKKLTPYEQHQFELFDHEKVLPAYEKFANELDSLNQSCTSAVDFRNIFDTHDQIIYFDNAHVTYQANEIIAENIFYEIFPIVNNYSN